MSIVLDPWKMYLLTMNISPNCFIAISLYEVYPIFITCGINGLVYNFIHTVLEQGLKFVLLPIQPVHVVVIEMSIPYIKFRSFNVVY